MTLGPAPVLALIVGLIHTSLYVLIRGSAGGRFPLLLAAAFLGAWVGDALGARLAVDPVRVGDFHVVFASIVAWVGLVVIGIAGVIGPEQGSEGRP